MLSVSIPSRKALHVIVEYDSTVGGNSTSIVSRIEVARTSATETNKVVRVMHMSANGNL